MKTQAPIFPSSHALATPKPSTPDDLRLALEKAQQDAAAAAFVAAQLKTQHSAFEQRRDRLEQAVHFKKGELKKLQQLWENKKQLAADAWDTACNTLGEHADSRIWDSAMVMCIQNRHILELIPNQITVIQNGITAAEKELADFLASNTHEKAVFLVEEGIKNERRFRASLMAPRPAGGGHPTKEAVDKVELELIALEEGAAEGKPAFREIPSVIVKTIRNVLS